VKEEVLKRLASKISHDSQKRNEYPGSGGELRQKERIELKAGEGEITVDV